MNLSRKFAFSFLVLIFFSIFILSQLDNATTAKVYAAACSVLNIDLKTMKFDVVQISNGGHTFAGFVLTGFSLCLIRRWWVLPALMFYFLGIEAAQLLTVDRQANWLDVFRSWAGIASAWGFLAILWKFTWKMREGKGDTTNSSQSP